VKALTKNPPERKKWRKEGGQNQKWSGVEAKPKKVVEKSWEKTRLKGEEPKEARRRKKSFPLKRGAQQRNFGESEGGT